MVNCSVRGCRNYSSRKNQKVVRYFGFPNDKNLQKQWLKVCDLSLKKEFVNNYRVCSVHFTEDDYSLKDQLLNTPFEKRKLKKDAVPSVNVPKPLIISNRMKRHEQRHMKQLVEELLLNAEKEEEEKKNDNEEIQVKKPVFETVTISLIDEKEIAEKLDENRPENLTKYELMKEDESEGNNYPIVYNYSEGHNYTIVHNHSEEHNYSENPYHIKEYNPSEKKEHFAKQSLFEKQNHFAKQNQSEKQTHFAKQSLFEKQNHFAKQSLFEKQNHFAKQNQSEKQNQSGKHDNSVDQNNVEQDMSFAVLVDTGIQTQGELNCIALLEVYELRRKLNAANKEIKKQENEIMKLKENEYKLDARLKRIFTLKQIEKLKNSPNRTKWTYDDLTSAMRLYVLGPRSYKYLLDKNYPLPSVKTLKRLNHIIKNYKNSLDNSVKNHFYKDLEMFSKFNEQIN